MFEPKPVLMKLNGKPAPLEIKGRALNGSQQIMASLWKSTHRGESTAQFTFVTGWADPECVARCRRDRDKVVLDNDEGKSYRIANPAKVDSDTYVSKVAIIGKAEGVAGANT